MRLHSLLTTVALFGLLAVAAHAQTPPSSYPDASASAPDRELAARGRYVAIAADCLGCHTMPGGGTPFAGGRYMETPFGQIASLNITPDKETGIGTWSDDDFYRALHEGIRKDGSYIYPVMPFPHYTQMTRDDVKAVRAYLFSLPPAHSPEKPTKLPFPLNIRTSLLGWRILYFKEGAFKPVEGKTEEYNRGAYLVDALGHCAMCHTARTVLGGPSSANFEGGQLQGWYAPNLTSDVREGLGGWSVDQVVTYLKTGTAPGKGVAVGPMRETIRDSLQYMTDQDLRAIAVYLKDVPAKEQDKTQRDATAREGGAPENVTYLTYCASCHQANGQGIKGAVPNLAGNQAVAAAGPATVYHAILGGLPATNTYTRMPSFAGALSNEEIASVTNYVRTNWGNTGPRDASLDGVAQVRKMTQGYLSGTAPECPLPEISQEAYKAATDPRNGILDILRAIDPATVFEKVDQAVAKLRQVLPNVPNADIINGLYDAECQVLAQRNDVSLPTRRWQLNRLADVVYVQLNPNKEAMNIGAPPPPQTK